MHRVEFLICQVIALSNLFDAFRAAAAGKRDQPEVRAFEFHLETNLWAIRRDLEAGDYPWGNYRRFRIHDPKEREIRAAPFRDRVVHHAIFNVIDPILRRGFITDTYACIPGRGAHAAVQRYRAFARSRRGRGYRLQCDIKSYFASVDHAVLIERLARRVGDERMLALLRSLIAHGGERSGVGMPIGNLTSQLFANLYLDPLDHFVKETLRVRHYIRRRSVRRLWRRLPALKRRLEAGQTDSDAVRSSIASWFGLAAHADAFRLSRAIFRERDVDNIGKRLLLHRLAAPPRPTRRTRDRGT